MKKISTLFAFIFILQSMVFAQPDTLIISTAPPVPPVPGDSLGQTVPTPPTPPDPAIVVIEEGQDTIATDTTKASTTEINLSNMKITIQSNADDDDDDDEKPKKKKRDDLTWWNGIDVGVNGILTDDYNFDLGEDLEYLEPEYGRSRYVSFNLFEVKGRIIQDYVGITSGVGLQFYSFKYTHNHTFTFNDTLDIITDSTLSLNKNKIRVTYLAIPLMLEFNTSLDKDKAFHISAGVVGKLRVGNMYKQRHDQDGRNHTDKFKGDLLTNPFAADAIVKVGYRNFTLFAQTSLTPLFDTDAAPDVRTFAAGLSINLF